VRGLILYSHPHPFGFAQGRLFPLPSRERAFIKISLIIRYKGG
jgi:hypothetical protein